MCLRADIIKEVQKQNNGKMDREMCAKARDIIVDLFFVSTKSTEVVINEVVTKLNEEKGCKA